MKIPFTPDGDQFPLVPDKNLFYHYSLQPKENGNFEEELMFDYFTIIADKYVMAQFKNENGNIRYMHLDELERIIKIDQIRKGKIKGVFRYSKDKETYSIYLRDDLRKEEIE